MIERFGQLETLTEAEFATADFKETRPLGDRYAIWLPKRDKPGFAQVQYDPKHYNHSIAGEGESLANFLENNLLGPFLGSLGLAVNTKQIREGWSLTKIMEIQFSSVERVAEALAWHNARLPEEFQLGSVRPWGGGLYPAEEAIKAKAEYGAQLMATEGDDAVHDMVAHLCGVISTEVPLQLSHRSLARELRRVGDKEITYGGASTTTYGAYMAWSDSAFSTVGTGAAHESPQGYSYQQYTSRLFEIPGVTSPPPPTGFAEHLAHAVFISQYYAQLTLSA